MEHGIQQKEMARQMGISQNALGSIEKELWVPKMRTIEKFCEVTDVPVAQLFLDSMGPEDFCLPERDCQDVLDIVEIASRKIQRAKVVAP
jgi:DNA-binding XRE family transcriptional regulator